MAITIGPGSRSWRDGVAPALLKALIYPGRYLATVLPTETPQYAFVDNAEVNGKLKAKQVLFGDPAAQCAAGHHRHRRPDRLHAEASGGSRRDRSPIGRRRL